MLNMMKDVQGKIKYFLLIWGLLMLATIIYVVAQYYFAFKPQDQISSLSIKEIFASPKTTPINDVIQTPNNSSNNFSEVIPVKIKIPIIGIDANTQLIDAKENGVMGTPTNYYDVGWFKLGPKPGEKGNAIIIGHLDTRTSPNAVFFNLYKLKIGDEIIVENNNNTTLVFKVTESKTYKYDQSPEEVFGQTEKKRLNLITCAGNWLEDKKMYEERLIVSAEMI